MKWTLMTSYNPMTNVRSNSESPGTAVANTINKRIQLQDSQDGSNHVDKRDSLRNSNNKVCDCTNDHYEVIELGDDFYPSELITVKCEQKFCNSIKYPVQVLQKQTFVDGELNWVPKDIIVYRWQFVKVEVIVVCTCHNVNYSPEKLFNTY